MFIVKKKLPDVGGECEYICYASFSFSTKENPFFE
jgi:hypothetical protein